MHLRDGSRNYLVVVLSPTNANNNLSSAFCPAKSKPDVYSSLLAQEMDSAGQKNNNLSYISSIRKIPCILKIKGC